MRWLYIYPFFVIVSSGLCAAGSTVCNPPQALQRKLQAKPGAETYAEIGQWHSDHAQYSCAVASFREAVKRAPKSGEFLYSLGLNLLRKGDFNGALNPLRESVALQPDVLKPHLLLATALEELHRSSEARLEWMAAVKIDPHSELALDGASKNFLANHEFDSVIALLGPEPKGEALIVDLASAYQGTGDTEEAIDLLTKGLEANPSSMALTRALITNLILTFRYQEAAKLGAKLVQQSPRDFEAQVLYLHVLVLNDDEELARPLAKKLLAAAPHDFGVLYLNGVLENRAGHYSAGRTFLQEAVALHPDDRSSRFNFGLALANLGDAQAAKTQFEKALALGATDPGVRFEYAKVLRTLGETELAAEQLKRYQQEQKALADRSVAASKAAQADKELANGDPAKAVALYRDAVTASPENALLNYKLSIALDRIGDTAEERKALEKAIQIDPTMAIARRQLGYLAFNSGDFETAEAQFREAVRAAPAYTDAWVSLAATLATESRHADAMDAVKRALEIDPQNANAIELQKELANAPGQTNQ